MTAPSNHFSTGANGHGVRSFPTMENDVCLAAGEAGRGSSGQTDAHLGGQLSGAANSPVQHSSYSHAVDQ